jgi:hypothetical protein
LGRQCQKSHHAELVMPSKIQKLYNINLLAAFAVSIIILIYLFLYTFSVIQVDSKFSFVATAVIFALFLPVNLFIWIQNTNYKLKIPRFVSQKFLKILPTATFIIFVIVLICGILVYPRAPIKAYGNTYIDKNGGSNYTYAQFRNYQKWEVAYIITWSICALQGIVLLPFYDRESKTWRYGHKQ